MLLCPLPLQISIPVPNHSQWSQPFAGMSMVVVCDRQDILSLVLISSVVLFPQGLNLELSTCTTQGLALVRARQPQLLVCIEPLAEGDALALISQAKRLPTAPKTLLIGNSADSRLSSVAVTACCDGILGAEAADAGAVFQALRAVTGGNISYRNHPVTPASRNGNVVHRLQSQGVDKLTARERQVLQLIVGGYSNQEISQHLHLGASTVKTHVSRLLDKLDARDRTQAAVRALALGLAPWPAGGQVVGPSP